MTDKLDVMPDEDTVLDLAIELGDLARRVRREREARRRVDGVVTSWAPPIRINLDDVLPVAEYDA